jgi:hypothetical protein
MALAHYGTEAGPAGLGRPPDKHASLARLLAISAGSLARAMARRARGRAVLTFAELRAAMIRPNFQTRR